MLSSCKNSWWMLLPVKQIKHKIILRQVMGILEVMTSIYCFAIKDHFLYIYEKIANCSGRKQKFLFTRPSPLATPALGKLYLRKTRISRFWGRKRISENLPWVPETFHARIPDLCRYSCLRPWAEGSRHLRDKKPLVPRVLYLAISGKLRHGPQFALICSLQKWGGGLYLRALDEET